WLIVYGNALQPRSMCSTAFSRSGLFFDQRRLAVLGRRGGAVDYHGVFAVFALDRLGWFFFAFDHLSRIVELLIRAGGHAPRDGQEIFRQLGLVDSLDRRASIHNLADVSLEDVASLALVPLLLAAIQIGLELAAALLDGELYLLADFVVV